MASAVACGGSGGNDASPPPGAASDAGGGPALVDAGDETSPGQPLPTASDSGASKDAALSDDAGASEDAAGGSQYGADGPSGYTTSSLQVGGPNGTFTTTAYVPSGTSPMPVVILSSGLQQPAAAYAPYGERLASWGIIALLRDDPGVLGEGSPAIAADVSYEVSTWLSSMSTSASGALSGKVDVSRIGLAGHSRGGQVALMAAAQGAHGLLKGVFGLDPVDSSTDGGAGLAAAGIASIGVPIAFIGETTDSAASSCAPAGENYLSLYQAAASPIVSLTRIGADHTMFEDPGSCAFCTFCTPGSANATQVLADAERYLTAFFGRVLLGDASVGPTFGGAGAPADVAVGILQLESK
jgi:dienelactone hydrolase